MVLVLVGTSLLAIGLLIGLGLHGRIIDQKYRRLAHLVQEFNHQQDVAAHDNHRAYPEGRHRVGRPAEVLLPR